MTRSDSQLPWTQPGWHEQASEWIHSELETQGIYVIGPIEQPHVRPWSTVLRVPTTEGDVYFKATAPSLAHEPALTQALARWHPEGMPRVLATDLARGWMLVPDFGVTLRSQIHSPEDLHRWEYVLPLYAEIQIELVARTRELLSLRALDRRLSVLPERYEQLLEDVDALLIDQQDGLTSEEYRQLRTLAPEITTMCEELAGYRIPETIHHEDFHDANIFVRDGRYLLSDWGESGVSHPFCTLLVTLRSTAYRLKLEEDDPGIMRLRDIYLEPWTAFESRSTLLDAFQLAYRVGMICRALTWHRVVSPLPEPFKSEHIGTVPGWLQELLEYMSK